MWKTKPDGATRRPKFLDSLLTAGAAPNTQQKSAKVNVRYWHKADIDDDAEHVRF
jgi:hypothetical protein